MSDPDINPTPVDIQAELSESARAYANRAAERANLEAAILRFNTNNNPAEGPPPGRDLPRLISPTNRRPGNPPVLPPRVMDGVQPRDRPKEGARLISPACSSSCLNKEIGLGV